MVNDTSKELERAMADSSEVMVLKATIAAHERQAKRARQLLLEAGATIKTLEAERSRLEQSNFNMRTHLLNLRDSFLFPFFPGWFKRAVISEVGKRSPSWSETVRDALEGDGVMGEL